MSDLPKTDHELHHPGHGGRSRGAEYHIRDCRAADLARVTLLNDAEVPHVTAFETGWPQWYLERSAAFRVVEQTPEESDVATAVAEPALAAQPVFVAEPVAFLIGLWPGLSYPSLNYRFFVERFGNEPGSFFYVDRLAVAPEHRRAGLGRRLYADAARIARARTRNICCEVNLRPANEVSLEFHHRLGFREVGRQQTEAGKKEVLLLVLELTEPLTSPLVTRAV